MGLFVTKKTATKTTGEKVVVTKKVLDPVAQEALKQQMKSRAHKILVRPLVTEKLANLANIANQYAFEVTSQANKTTVAQVVSALYDVNVIQVRTVTVKGKTVNYGKSQGRTKNWKKALVTLKAGEKIDIFAGV